MFERLKFGRVAALISIMIVIMLVFGTSLGLMLYKFNIKQHEKMLGNILSTRENLINTLLDEEKENEGAKFDYKQARAKIIHLLNEAKNRDVGVGISGEIVLAEKQGDFIVFVNRHRFDKNTPTKVPFNSEVAIPMQLALKGKIGFIIAPDYRDEEVLAAYRYVSSIDAGIVVKQDYSEITESYLVAITYAGIIGIILILIGVVLFLKLGDRFTIELNEAFKELETVFNSSLDAKWLVDKNFNIIRVNRTFLKMFNLSESDVVGRKCYDVLKNKLCETGGCHCSKLREKPEQNIIVEDRKIKVFNKNEFNVQSFATALTDEKNRFQGMFESFLDVSERKKREKSIKDENEQQKMLNDLSLNLQNKSGLKPVCDEVLSFLCKYFGANIGRIYIQNESVKKKYRFASGYGSNINDLNKEFYEGISLAGVAVKEKKRLIVNDIPDDYIFISSTLGSSQPKHLLIQPFIFYNEVIALCEIGSFFPINKESLIFIDRAFEIIAAALNSAISRNEIAKLLKQTEKQAEEVQTMNEELQASNEELEAQQEELKLANQDLETHTEKLRDSEERLIEGQRLLNQQNNDLLEKSELLEKQKIELENKSQELEVISQYKSEFLANMSHELRTPLNSLMILANRMSKNRMKNLTKEQIQDAEIIYKQGVDLLGLINNILDLSKIESGKVQLNIEKFNLNNLVKTIKTTFEPMAKEENLQLFVSSSSDVPEYIITDWQRLEQIVRNLVSNAIKFTEKGKIDIKIERPGIELDLSSFGMTKENSIAISVLDTGIGIDEDKQSEIFEAFQQLDNNLKMKYGGTGLGLSISRKLARFLGGEIFLKSKKGEGSKFILVIKEQLDIKLGQELQVDAAVVVDALKKEEREKSNCHKTSNSAKEDSSIEFSKRGAIILAIESDTEFSNILYNKCNERGYEFIHVDNVCSGFEIIYKRVPNAIIFDIDLCDKNQFGLQAFNSFKRDINTRHIPVFVLSADAKNAEVLRNGAMIFMKKPVEPKKVDKLFDRISEVLVEEKKRLLIVEDDKTSVNIIKSLFDADDVITDIALSGEEAVNKISKTKYNCVILDLGLKDISGFEVLKRIEEFDFIPPVVIYTGKDISIEENNLLNKYTDSIIIKSALSEERLIDEVSLFLHMKISAYNKHSNKILNNILSADKFLKGAEVLIVDDDMRNLYSLEAELKDHGLKIYKATDGQNAIEVLRDNDGIDMIIMDIMMPVMNGYECMRKIRQNNKWKKLPIVALTAKAMPGEKDKCVSAGADDYISKPIDINKLLSKMLIWIDREEGRK